jgi:simple sugar transport system substrate-binding protein
MLKKINLLLLLVLTCVALLVLPVVAQVSEGPIVIYFFPGGAPGSTFATVVYNGAQAAAEILGNRVEVRYLWSDWSQQKMVDQFQQAVAANPDGIAIMGHPGDEAYRPFVEEAEKQGIIVCSQNTTLPELEKAYSANGFGYVGQGLYESGYTLGEATIKRAGLKTGDRALVWGLLSQPTRGLRTKGAIDAFKKAGVIVDYLEISAEVDKDASNGIPVISGYLQANPDCKAVVTDHGDLTSSQRTFFETAGLGPDDIFGAGFDLSAPTVESIKSGYTDLVLDQQPFLQGFLPIMQIYLTKLYGFSGLHIDTGGGLISKDNIDLVAPLAEKGIR